jgi:glycosyltransferase involved in cell wall biosynthesis
MSVGADPDPTVRPVRVCHINLYSYPALWRDPARPSPSTGGAELQQAMIARAAARRGVDSSFVTLDVGQGREIVVDRLRILAAYRREQGLPGLRFFHPRLSGLYRALRRADADVYFLASGDGFLGVVAWIVRRLRRRLVLRIVSDADCDPRRQIISTFKDPWLYRYGIRRVDVVLAQTEQQREMLRRNFGIESEVVADMVAPWPRLTPPEERDIDVIWVAHLRALKRPEMFVELAQRLPRYRFHLVGGDPQQGNVYLEQLRVLARGVPNLTLHGSLGQDETLGLFDRARLLVNTSDIEGLPNTFYQAWVRAIPVVSFLDPDQRIVSHGLGAAVPDFETLVATVRDLLADDPRRHALGKQAVTFMRAHYDPERLIEPYLAVFRRFAPVRPAIGEPLLPASAR